MRLFSSENVAKPVDLTDEYKSKTMEELRIDEKRFTKNRSLCDPYKTHDEIQKIREDAEVRIRVITKIIQDRIAETDNALKLENKLYMQNTVPKWLCDLRYTVNPPSTTNCLPYGQTIDMLQWQKPTTEIIHFQYPVYFNDERGHRCKKIEEADFNILEIPADTFKRMIANPFQHEIFRVKNETLYIMRV